MPAEDQLPKKRALTRLEWPADTISGYFPHQTWSAVISARRQPKVGIIYRPHRKSDAVMGAEQGYFRVDGHLPETPVSNECLTAHSLGWLRQ